MLGSGRSRLHMPSRNRRDHQGQRPTLPCFPRWCGPMGSAVRGLSIMSRPQLIPKRSPCQSRPYGMGRATTPHSSSLPQSWSMSQPLRSLLPEPRCIPPPKLVRLLNWFFRPKSTGAPLPHRSPSKSGTTEASKVYGFDLNENWMGDREHYDNQKVNGWTFPRVISLLPSLKNLTLKDVIPCSPSGSFANKNRPTITGFGNLLMGESCISSLRGISRAAVFATELLSQLRTEESTLIVSPRSGPGRMGRHWNKLRVPNLRRRS